MKRSRSGDEQIIGILKEHQAGLSAVDLCRMYGVSDATFYKWCSTYGGMDVAEAKRHRAKHGRSRRRVRHIDVVSGMRQCRRQSDKHGWSWKACCCF
jgi:transposase